MSIFHTTIITIFPEIFPGPLGYSLAGKALTAGIWSFDTVNLRDFGVTRHKNVDDTPYGGGNGLIMRPDVLGDSIDYALKKHPNSTIYYPSPRGKLLNQKLIKEIITHKEIIILCGRFEGIDERIIEEYNIQEISVGDYILSGGEIAAFSILDCIVRLLPGVLTNSSTLESESFENIEQIEGILEYPLYTKPAIWRGRQVPSVLLSGNHGELSKWRQQQALALTKKRRPDLLK